MAAQESAPRLGPHRDILTESDDELPYLCLRGHDRASVISVASIGPELSKKQKLTVPATKPFSNRKPAANDGWLRGV